MPADFGLSFNPGATKPGQPAVQQGPSQTPIQDAIRTLSLRIPTFRGPGLAPLPLLQSAGSQGVMGAMGGAMPGGLQQILQQMFGNQQQGQAQGSANLPNFVPGAGPSIPQQPQQPVINQPPQGQPSYGFSDPQVPDSGHYFPGNWPR